MKNIINTIMQWIMAVVVAMTFGIIGCDENQNQVQTSPPEYHEPTAKSQPETQPATQEVRPVSRENLGVTIKPVERKKPKPQPRTQPVVKNLPPTEAQTLSETLERQKVMRTKKRYYVMKQGDTLWSISRRFYGSGKYWKKIAKANPGIDIANVKTGQKIVLPY